MFNSIRPKDIPFAWNTFLKCSILFSAGILLMLSACKKDKSLEDDNLPQVTTTAILPITPTRVTLKGSLSSKGRIKILDYGFVYDVRGYFDGPTMKTISLGSAAQTGEFTAEIEGLNPGFNVNDREFLYAKAYFTNKFGTVYGERLRVAMPYLVAKNISPRQGKIGDQISLEGDFFASGSKLVKVRFNQIEAKIISATDKKIVVEVPAGIPLRHGESVGVDVNIDGQLTPAGDFTILATFKDFSPKSGPTNTVIHFTGENLPAGFSSAEGIEIMVGGVKTYTFAYQEFTATALESNQVKVKVAAKINGVQVELPGEFTYVSPVITSMSPTSALANEVITFKGTNFPLATPFHYGTMKVGTATASASPYNGDVIASIPLHLEPGTYPVSFISGPFTITMPQQLTVKPYQMFSLSPATGFPLTELSIKGTFNRFQEYFVYFGDQRIKGTAISNTEVLVAAPLADHGTTLKAVAEMVGGQKIPVPGVFVVKGPLITSFSPSSGGPGTQVTIKGANFRSEFGVGIDLGTGYAPVDEVTENTIKFTIPRIIGSGTNKLKVTINSQSAVSASSFTVIN
jgi:hypothetical protein